MSAAAWNPVHCGANAWHDGAWGPAVGHDEVSDELVQRWAQAAKAWKDCFNGSSNGVAAGKASDVGVSARGEEVPPFYSQCPTRAAKLARE
jgi:hypothetical protein